MEFFNKLTEKATKTYKYTANQTSKLAKEAKIKMKINDKKSEIEDLYTEIGKKVYNNYSSLEGINIIEEIKEKIDKVHTLLEEIDKEQIEVLKLKDRKKCNNCNKEIEYNCKYCPECGAKQEMVEEPKEEHKEECCSEDCNKEECKENSCCEDCNKECKEEKSE